MSARSDLLEAALDYASRGWRVVPLHSPTEDGGCSCRKRPCSSPAKHPRTRNGATDATTREETLRRWWGMWPDANLGVATGETDGGERLCVIDVDNRHSGNVSLAELESEHGDLSTLCARTGGGVHLYFEAPAELRNGAGIRPGLDVRGAGGYVVAPPSIHVSGARYEWIPDHPRDPQPMPRWLLELVQAQPGAPDAGNGAGPAPPVEDRIPDGQRNATLASLAGTMRRRGMQQPEILAALRELNARRCSPPLPAREVEAIASSVSRYAPAQSPGAKGGATVEPEAPLSDTRNSAHFVRLHGDRLRYIPMWGRWIVWSVPESRWVVDHQDVLVRELAKDVGRALQAEAATVADDAAAKRLFTFARRSLNANAINGMVDLARGIDGIPLQHETLDADGSLLGVANGTINLRDGTFRAAVPTDLMTLQCPVEYDPAAEAPRWERALEEWFPDPDLRAYVHRLAGAAIVGDQREHVFVIHYGGGGNGKGTFTRALQRVLGPYAVEIHLSLLVQTRYREHDTVRADLFRARLAVAVETERRVKLAEASVKNLSGGDRIRARRMREDYWSFDPTHSLWLQTNHLPHISGRDTGIWRRIRVVRWQATFDGAAVDRDLDTKLGAEAPGILRWLVEGCLAWQREGLGEPEAVVRETLAYRAREDVFTRFAEDTGVVFRPGLEIAVQELHELLEEWAASEGIEPPRRELAEWLEENEATKTQRRITGPDGKQKRPRLWLGVGLDDGDHDAEQTGITF